MTFLEVLEAGAHHPSATRETEIERRGGNGMGRGRTIERERGRERERSKEQPFLPISFFIFFYLFLFFYATKEHLSLGLIFNFLNTNSRYRKYRPLWNCNGRYSENLNRYLPIFSDMARYFGKLAHAPFNTGLTSTPL